MYHVHPNLRLYLPSFVPIVSSSHRQRKSRIYSREPDRWTVETYRGILPQSVLFKICNLLANTFSREFDSNNLSSKDYSLADVQNVGNAAPSIAPSEATYIIRLMTELFYRGFEGGSQFIAVTGRSKAQSDKAKIAAVVTLAPGLGSSIDGELDKDSPCTLNKLIRDHTRKSNSQLKIASISNMAVSSDFRRQGGGRRVLAAVEVAAGEWPVPPDIFVLCVYKSNLAAINLYSQAGYQLDEGWVDPRWLKEAESGKLGKERRLLMIKQVQNWEEEN